MQCFFHGDPPNCQPEQQSAEKAVPDFFSCRLAKGASVNLTIFLALSEPAKLGTTSPSETRHHIPVGRRPVFQRSGIAGLLKKIANSAFFFISRRIPVYHDHRGGKNTNIFWCRKKTIRKRGTSAVRFRRPEKDKEFEMLTRTFPGQPTVEEKPCQTRFPSATAGPADTASDLRPAHLPALAGAGGPAPAAGPAAACHRYP